MTNLLYTYGKIHFYPSSGETLYFEQSGELEYNYFAYLNTGGRLTLQRCDYTGITTPPSIATFGLFGDCGISELSPGAPGGDTIQRGTPAYLNAKGVAKAAGYVSAAGVLSNAFGVTSVTKTATGTYTLQCSFAPLVALISALNGTVLATWSMPGSNTVVIYTRNASGTLVDSTFSFAIY
jgi:hypothetical protein